MRCQPNHSPKPPFSIHAPTTPCTGPDSRPMCCLPNPLPEAPIFNPCSDRRPHRPGFPSHAPLSEPTRRSPHFQSMLRPPPAQARNPFPCAAFRIHSPKPPFSIHAPIAACTGPDSLTMRCLPNPLAEAPIFYPCSDRRPHRPWGSEFTEQVRPYRPQGAHANAQRPSDRTCRTAAIYQTPYLLYRARSHSMQSSSHTMNRRVPVGISARFSRSSSVGDISPSG